MKNYLNQTLYQLYIKAIYYLKRVVSRRYKNLETLSFENDTSQEIDRVNLLAKCYDKIDDIDNAFSYFEKQIL